MEPMSPKYTGVRKRKWGKWVAEIRLPNSRERIWLGSFDSPEKAARAFDAALYCLRGSGARFNFPENPPEIPDGRSLTPQQIQVVAHRYASEEFLPLQQQEQQSLSPRGEMIISARGEISGGSTSTLGQAGEDISNTTTYNEFGSFYLDDDPMNFNFTSTQELDFSSDFYYDIGVNVEEDYSHYNVTLWNF
ncbi:unnamed protein product [Cochlearia groenlandica]